MYRGGVFGSVAIPFVDASGVVGVEDVALGHGCAVGEDISPTQRMLFDLGIYAGPIDGRMNPLTRIAITSFALANRVPRGEFCSTLTSAWQKKTAPIVEQLRKFAQDMQNRQTASLISQTRLPATSAKDATPGWWDSQSTAVKIGIGVGALALALLGAKALRTKKSYTPNKPQKRKRHAKRKSHAGERGAARRRKRRGMPTAVEKFGRSHPPKGYPKKRSAYAWPEGWKYPIDSRHRVRNAASRFGKYKHRYPLLVREKIAHRIDMAKKRFHIGEYR